MKKTCSLILLVIITLACQEPKHFGNLKMDIETFDYDFNVEEFYAFNGNDNGTITANADASIKEVIASLKPIEITYYRTATKRKKDSVRPIMGKEYAMRIWNAGDSVAYYGNYYFSKIDMLQSNKKDLIGVACTDIKGDEFKAKELLDYIISKEGQPEEKIVQVIYPVRIYTWHKKDRTIALALRYPDIPKKPFISDEMTEEELEQYELPEMQIRLFSINSKYKKMVTDNLYRGEWMYMQLKSRDN